MSFSDAFQVTVTRKEDFEFWVDFGQDGFPRLLVDEPPPLGEAAGPNAARLLAAAVGNCLSASLVYCLRKAKAEPEGVRAKVMGTLERNHRGRLRIRELRVELTVDEDPGAEGGLERCMELFEDYCIVTESVRNGIDVLVEVRRAGEAREPGQGAKAASGDEESLGEVGQPVHTGS